MGSIGSRLREERDRLGASQEEFAAIAGASRKSQIRYETDDRSPDGLYLAAIAKRGADVGFILTGSRSPVSTREALEIRAGFGRKEDLAHAMVRQAMSGVSVGPLSDPLTTPEAPDAAFFAIPLHDAELAAGGGAVNDGEPVVGSIAFSRDWLRSIGVTPSAARLARTRGPSMEPTIFDQDWLLVDTASQTLPERPRPKGDGRPCPIFSLLDEGEARVKRVERLDGKHVVLLSDNPDFAPEVRPISAITPIGRVASWLHTVRR